MAGSAAAESQQEILDQPRRQPNALARIGYASILDSDMESSSGDDVPETRWIGVDDAQALLAVSISKEQTRLTSAKTPAAEKAAALEDSSGYFAGAWLSPGQQKAEARKAAASQSSTAATTKCAEEAADLGEARPQSGERSAESPKICEMPRKHTRSGALRSSLQDAFSTHKRKSSISDFVPNLTLPHFTKNLNFTVSNLVPSLPPFDGSIVHRSVATLRKDSLPSRDPSAKRASDSKDPKAQPRIPQRRSTISEMPQSLLHQNQDLATSGTALYEQTDHLSQLPGVKPPLGLNEADSQAGRLRRSASDDSLWLRRSLSIVPSLGDDSRFEHVQAQINSRVKAFKDTLEEIDWTIPYFSFSKIKEFSTGEDGKYSNFAKALDGLTGDVVVLGGYRGSVLRSTEKGKPRLWAPLMVGLNLRKANLQLGLTADDEEDESSRVFPDGMLTHIGPIDISRRLLQRMRACENARTGKLRVHDFGYDWRLCPTRLTVQFLDFLKSLPCNRPGMPATNRGATVIAHSLGGLITRHAVNLRPEMFAGVVYAGVPQHAVNILGPLRNGDEVGLNTGVMTAQVNFTIRTSFALLPLDGTCFIDEDTLEEYPVDFFNPEDWVKYAWSPCISRPLPAVRRPNTKANGGPLSDFIESISTSLPNFSVVGRKNARGTIQSPKKDNSNPSMRYKELNGYEAKSQRGVSNPLSPDMDQNHEAQYPTPPGKSNIATDVTIPWEDAYRYLERTLHDVKGFKKALEHDPAFENKNSYPPFAVLFGKNEPTVVGAKVKGRDGIRRADAYSNLRFGSGDGVVLSAAAQLPKGYKVAPGGWVETTKGHVSLLSDLDGVGKCLLALREERKRGRGSGAYE